MNSRNFRSSSIGLIITNLFLCAGFAPAGAHSNLHADREIRTLLTRQADAWNRGDIEAFMDGYWKSGDTTFAGASGVERGWAALLARYQKTYPDRAAMGRLTFSNLEIHLLGTDTAYVIGGWQLEKQKGKPHGVFTLILRRFPEGWRIIHDHTSAFPVIQTPPTLEK